MDETLDIYSSDGEPLGRSKARALVHQDGDWHRTFHCWIIYREDSGREMIVFQRRAHDVELWPDKLDISAAGHYRSGETLEQGGLREIQEELGVAPRLEELIPAGIRVCDDKRLPGIWNRELQEVYFLIRQQPLETYAPQPSEVAGLVEIPVQTLPALLSGEREQATVPALMLKSNSRCYACQDVVVSSEDFLPSSDDNYFLRVAIAAQRILRGEKHIRI